MARAYGRVQALYGRQPHKNRHLPLGALQVKTIEHRRMSLPAVPRTLPIPHSADSHLDAWRCHKRYFCLRCRCLALCCLHILTSTLL